MGRTLPSITMAFLQEQASFACFRRALRRADQHALDDLFAAAHRHLAAAAHAAHPLPFEVFLLAMLLEEHKQSLRQQEVLYALLTGTASLEDLAALLVPPEQPGSEAFFAAEPRLTPDSEPAGGLSSLAAPGMSAADLPGKFHDVFQPACSPVRE